LEEDSKESSQTYAKKCSAKDGKESAKQRHGESSQKATDDSSYHIHYGIVQSLSK